MSENMQPPEGAARENPSEPPPLPPVHDEQLFRYLVERVKDYAIFMLDVHGRVLTWNAGAESLKGYKAHQIVGQSFDIFYPQEARQQGTPYQLLDLARRQGRCEHEGWRVRKDGTQFWAKIVITAVYNDADELLGFAKITQDLTERRAAELTLLNARHDLEERVKQRTDALEQANAVLSRINEELRESKLILQEKINELEQFHDVVVGRELKLMELEREIGRLRKRHPEPDSIP